VSAWLAQLPVLLVALPLLGAPLCVLVRNRSFAWLLASLIAVACFLVAVLVFQQVLANGSITYELGGWAAPLGIVYQIDLLNSFVLLIVSGIAAVVLPYARQSVMAEIDAARGYLFYAALLLLLTGLLGIAITGDAFNVFVFLEISSLSSYALMGMGRNRRALTAAFNYLIMGTLGGTFLLLGIGLLYMLTGTLNMADLAERLPAVADNRALLAACVFITLGIGLKMAMFPLHFWLPNAYTNAPSVVTIFIAATGTKVAAYALLRFWITIIGVDTPMIAALGNVLLMMGVAGMLVLSIVAVFQNDVKRLLALSSVAQIGYIVFGIGLLSKLGLTAAMLHLLNHAVAKCLLFMCLGAIMLRINSSQLQDWEGLGRRMPWTMAAFVVGGLSLIGVPLTAGFVSKWYLVRAALEHGQWPLVLAILLSSLLAVVYVWKVVEVAYLKGQDVPSGRQIEAPTSMLAMIWLMVAANVYFGVDTQFSAGVVEQAVGQLMGSRP